MKSCLPSRKIYLSQTTGWHFFRALLIGTHVDLIDILWWNLEDQMHSCLTFISFRDINLSIPNSIMSKIWPSKQRPMTRLWGLFLECEPKRNKDASFLTLKNSREVWSSNGLMIFFLWNMTELGFLSKQRSFMAWVTVSLVLPPRMNNAVFVFSKSLGARCSITRFPRCVLGRLIRKKAQKSPTEGKKGYVSIRH